MVRFVLNFEFLKICRVHCCLCLLKHITTCEGSFRSSLQGHFHGSPRISHAICFVSYIISVFEQCVSFVKIAQTWKLVHLCSLYCRNVWNSCMQGDLCCTTALPKYESSKSIEKVHPTIALWIMFELGELFRMVVIDPICFLLLPTPNGLVSQVRTLPRLA